jgi:hypothetical protein
MKKQEISVQAVVDVEMTVVDTLSVDLAAVVAPQNELNQAFENDKKIDEELELSQAKGEAVQVASADNGLAAMLLTDTNQAAGGAAVGGGGAAASAAISTNAFLIAGAVAVAAVAVVASDDDESAAPVATTPVDPDPVDPAPVDSEPVVSGNQSLSLVQGKSAVITVTATDADGDQLAFAPSNPANGTLNTTSQPGQYTYTANESFIGIDSFTVTVSDEDNNSITRTITIDVTKATVPVTELTAGEDQVLGGAEANVIDAKSPNNVSTLSASDNIDGGDGVDTLNIYSDNANNINNAVPASAEIKNVEIINVFNISTPAAGTNLYEASNYSGVTALNQIGVAAGAVTNLLATTTAGFTSTVGAIDVTAEAAATSATVNLSDIDTANAPTLDVAGAALSSLTVTGTTTGVAALNLDVIAGKDVESLTVSTAVDSTLTVTDGTGKTVKTVDASGSTGDVTYATASTVANVTTGTGNDVVSTGVVTNNSSFNTGAGNDSVTIGHALTGATAVALGDGTNTFTNSVALTDTLTITSGSGVDTINTNGATKLTITTGAGDDVITAVVPGSSVVIDGGDGTDTVGLSAPVFVPADYTSLNAGLTNVEQLLFETANTTGVDGSKLKADFTQLTFTGPVGSSNSAFNITAAQKIVASQIDATATGYTQSTALAVVTGGVLNIEAVQSAAVSTVFAKAETVNLTVATDAAVNSNNATTLTGDFATANITLVSTENAGGDNFASVTLTTATPGVGTTSPTALVITGEGSATVNNAGDTLTTVDASDLSNTQSGGKIASGLNYTAGDSVETITLGGGTDTLTFGAATSTYGAMDNVIGFDAEKETADATSTTDSIVFGGLTLDGSNADQAILITLGNNTDSLLEAFKDAASENDGTEVSFFQFGGNTYLFQNDTGLGLGGIGSGTLEDSDRALQVSGLVNFADDFAVNV